jgi:hypothetical protein
MEKFKRATAFRFKTPIQKYNMVDIKHGVENAIRDLLVLEYGWKEDFSLLDLHLVLGYIACISGITSAVYGYTHDFDTKTKLILAIGSGMYLFL